MAREQQKIFLTPEARQRLRDEAERRGWELSEIVEYLVVKGGYPPLKQKA